MKRFALTAILLSGSFLFAAPVGAEGLLQPLVDQGSTMTPTLVYGGCGAQFIRNRYGRCQHRQYLNERYGRRGEGYRSGYGYR